jgi:hypothetical protein
VTAQVAVIGEAVIGEAVIGHLVAEDDDEDPPASAMMYVRFVVLSPVCPEDPLPPSFRTDEG